jgi:uncharacterized protein YdeI (BOF family)
MSKFLRSSLLSLIAVVLAVVPTLAQDEQKPENLDKLAGVYEFEAPDYGVISVAIALSEEKDVTISAMGAVPSVTKHIEGNLWEFDSPDFGLINIGFVEEDDGSVSAITIDSYDFSFIAFKKKQ